MFDPALQYQLQYALKCACEYRTCFGFCNGTFCTASAVFSSVSFNFLYRGTFVTVTVVTLCISDNYKRHQFVAIIVATKVLDN